MSAMSSEFRNASSPRSFSIQNDLQPSESFPLRRQAPAPLTPTDRWRRMSKEVMDRVQAKMDERDRTVSRLFGLAAIMATITLIAGVAFISFGAILNNSKSMLGGGVLIIGGLCCCVSIGTSEAENGKDRFSDLVKDGLADDHKVQQLREKFLSLSLPVEIPEHVVVMGVLSRDVCLKLNAFNRAFEKLADKEKAQGRDSLMIERNQLEAHLRAFRLGALSEDLPKPFGDRPFSQASDPVRPEMFLETIV